MPELTPEQERDDYRAQVELLRRRMEAIKASVARVRHSRADAEKLLASGRGGMLRRPAQQLLVALNEVEKEVL
jgi:hypothetical protein